MTHEGIKTLLVIDDEETFGIAVKEFLESERLRVLTAHSAAEGRAILAEHAVDVVLLDQRLPDGDGHALVPAITEKNDQAKIVFITAFPSVENARQAIRAGAHDYIAKPLDLEELKDVVDEMLRTLGLEQVAQLHAYEQERVRRDAVIIPGAGSMGGVLQLVDSASRTTAPVLLTGETGTGKSLIAKAIHFQSGVSKGPFISVNCATLPENLVESELFGYEKGAFTGAATSKKGLFEMADGGTLFLDEIGDMPIHLQSKLLQILDDGRLRRVGGTTLRSVWVRIIAATNADLTAALGTAFRRDLYYRLSVIHIHVPSLRERRDDIPALCDYLLPKLAEGKTPAIPEQEMARLMAYDWPGNVRELRNVLERACLMQRQGEIHPAAFLEPAFSPEGHEHAVAQQGTDGTGYRDKTIKAAEQSIISEALGRHAWNLVKTADALGMSLSTLKRRVKEYGFKRKPGST